MSVRAQLVTVEDYISAGHILRLSADQTLRIARACGLRIRNADWYDAWREYKRRDRDGDL